MNTTKTEKESKQKNKWWEEQIEKFKNMKQREKENVGAREREKEKRMVKAA